MEKASVCDQSLTENRLSLLSVWESKKLPPGREQAEMLIWGWNDMAVCVCVCVYTRSRVGGI